MLINVHTIRNKQKSFKNTYFLLETAAKKARIRIRNPVYGSKDPEQATACRRLKKRTIKLLWVVVDYRGTDTDPTFEYYAASKICRHVFFF